MAWSQQVREAAAAARAAKGLQPAAHSRAVYRLPKGTAGAMADPGASRLAIVLMAMEWAHFATFRPRGLDSRGARQYCFR